MTPLPCDRAREAMSDYLAGESDPAALAALESHLSECGGCPAELERLFLQDRAIGELVGLSLVEDLRTRLRSGLAKSKAGSRRVGFRRFLFIAATVLVAVGASAVWIHLPSAEISAIATLDLARGAVVLTSKDSSEPASRGMSVAEGQGLQTRGIGSRAIVRYPDGSEIELLGDTSVENLSDTAGAGKRLFVARGTVRAAVATQPSGRPMIVSSPQAQAKVLGTRLRVIVNLNSDHSTRLEVSEGKVGLTRLDDGASVEVPAGTFAVALKGVPLVTQPLATPAQSIVVEAGGMLALSEDIVLSGQDTMEVRGTAEKRCTIRGNRHRIRTSGEWTGKILISHCDLVELGDQTVFSPQGRITSQAHALELSAAKDAEISVEQSAFRASSSVSLRLDGGSTARFSHNVSSEDSIVWVDKAVERTVPFFSATGSSSGAKFFQGNRVYRSGVHITGRNWTIGGPSDSESNLIIGLRAGLFAYGEGTLVRGNYLHVLMPRTAEFPYWSQVATFTSARGALAEHNVIRDGEWIVQFVEGEFRHNLICDINDHNFLRNGSTGRIHHNLFVAGRPDHPPGSQSGCIFVVYAPKEGETGVEVFNNTFDAGGVLNIPGIEVNPGGFVKSLRNNVFFNFPHQEKYVRSAQAMVRPIWTEPLTDPGPAGLGYADYNAFFSPQAQVKKNYALTVAGKTERKDAGFALNDLPRGGSPNDQVDPRFKGPIPTSFLFKDEDIKSGAVTVSKMLARYRELYTPAPGSPLIDAGDPADGEGTDIGAVDAGVPARSK